MKNIKKIFTCVLVALMGIEIVGVCAEAERTEENKPETPRSVMIKSHVLDKLEFQEAEIDLSKYDLSLGEAEKLLDEVIKENTLVLDVYPQFSYMVENGVVENVEVSYTQKLIPMSETLTQQSEIDAEIDRILECVDSSMTDLEKALAVHDYFEVNYNYDYTYTIYNKEALFETKKGVCDAYAKAYVYIMNDLLGIECIRVVSDPMVHAWNMIKIDGNWYHVDCTWDDGYKCQHLHFMVSDSAMSDSEREHYDWYYPYCSHSGLCSDNAGCPYRATDTTYDNYYWKYAESKIHEINGYYYFINSDKEIIKRNISSGAEDVIYLLFPGWPVYDMPGYTWNGCFSGLEYTGGKLYANNPSKLISMDLNGENVKTVVTQDTDEGYIYGFVQKGNKLIYDISMDVYEFEVEASKSIRVASDSDKLIADITDYSVASGKTTVNTVIKNNENTKSNAILYVGVYNGDGKLLSVSTKNISVNGNQTATTPVTVNKAVAYGNVIKLFAWSDKFMPLSMNSSYKITEIRDGEKIVTGNAEFAVDYAEFMEEVRPPAPIGSYIYWPKQDGKVYADICFEYKNVSEADINAGDVMQAVLVYNKTTTYNGFKIIEKDNRSTFWNSISEVTVAPGNTEYIHCLFSLPENTKNETDPVEIVITVDGNEYNYKVR